MWAGWLINPEQPLAFIVPKEGKAEKVMAWLSRVGLEHNVVGQLSGGLYGWTEAGFPFEEAPPMSVEEVHHTFPTDGMQLVDVRQPSEWDMGHIPSARYIFLPELLKRHGELDRDKPVVLYCGTGYRASIGASLLRNAGFNARAVPGSYKAWQAEHYPVELSKEKKKASDTHRP